MPVNDCSKKSIERNEWQDERKKDRIKDAQTHVNLS